MDLYLMMLEDLYDSWYLMIHMVDDTSSITLLDGLYALTYICGLYDL